MDEDSDVDTNLNANTNLDADVNLNSPIHRVMINCTPFTHNLK